MLLALHVVDYGALAVYLAAMVAIGVYFSRQQHSSKDFFLAGRAMGWFPIGLSVMATLLSALSYTGIPGAAYYAGLKFLLSPLAVWLTLPIIVGFVLPLYQRLEIYSVYEYLELRFDLATRLAGSALFVVWRLLWLGGVLYAPCKVLVVAAGLPIPMWLLLIILGLVSTSYTYLGGIKAVIWTDVIQSIVMLGGLLLIIGAVWWRLPGGAGQVWQTTVDLQRQHLAEWSFSWSDPWYFWGILPHFTLAMLSFYVADQITAQRFLTARNLKAARQSFLLNCISVSVMIPALLYVGLCLLAFYQVRPQEMRAIWVANVDGTTRQSITVPETRTSPLIDPLTGRPKRSVLTGEILMDPTSGKPLIDWNSDRLDASTIQDLVAQRRVLRPNTKEPFTDASGLVDPASGRVNIDALAMRRGDEIVLHQKAQDELLPRFITQQLPMGVAGLVLAALLAASMSSIDSGLNSVCTLMITDFQRRLGWGRRWLAARRGKSPDELNEQDELYLSRYLVLGLGVAATAFSMLVSLIDDIFSIMIAVVNTFGGPLLAVFLLGIFTRRTTPRAALVSLL
ncbi:MAG: hypothetical protein JJ992_29905, partial [Planctomycetes bacterium]|nr:hypothetical protein [Planctomycetota bacterium]